MLGCQSRSSQALGCFSIHNLKWIKCVILEIYELLFTIVPRRILSDFFETIIIIKNGKDSLQNFVKFRFNETGDYKTRARLQTFRIISRYSIYTFKIFRRRAKRFLELSMGVNMKLNIWIEKTFDFNLINFDVQGQTTTLVQKRINVFSGGAIVERFFVLTFSDVLVKAKVRVCCNTFFQDIQIVFSFSNQLNWFWT